MKILHYCLGLPPYRSGGLTKYSIDLALGQYKKGHKVAILYPGRYSLFYKKGEVIPNIDYQGIVVYELCNPTPVPLIYGVKDTSGFYVDGNEAKFKEFLRNNSFDIIHFHTFMGLHKNLMKIISNMKIKKIYTSHDYYGIWPEDNLLNDFSEKELYYAALGGITSFPELGTLKIYVMQSLIYRKTKNSAIISALRKKIKRQRTDQSNKSTTTIGSNYARYIELRNFYREYFDAIDKYYFNSTVAYSVFSKYLAIGENIILPILHKNIYDRRNTTKTISDKLSLLFIGGPLEYKGFGYLVSVLDKVISDGYQEFQLVAVGVGENERSYIKSIESYDFSQLNEIFREVDFLVVPSVWYETYGIGAIEALSFGVPIIVSNHVGAKNLVENNNDIGYVYADKKELKNILIKNIVDRGELNTFRESIKNNNTINFDFEKHVETVIENYQ